MPVQEIPAYTHMKQDKRQMATVSGVALLAIFLAVLAFIGLKQANSSTQKQPNGEAGQLSLVDQLATIDSSYLTQPPTAGPSPTPDAATGMDITTDSATLPTEEPQPEPITHTVQAGENLFRISLSYGVTVESILSANGLNDDRLIYPGQGLIIPLDSAGANAAESEESQPATPSSATADTLPATRSPIPATMTPSPPTETPIPPTDTPLPTPTRNTTISAIPLESFLIMPESVIENSMAIISAGRALGRNPKAYSKVGDSTIENPHFMARFDEGPYNLGEYAYLQGAIDQFSGSHARQGLAVRRGNHSWTITDPMWADKAVCQPNETSIACEIRVHNPSILFIRLGSNDQGVPAGFDQNLRQIVQIAIDGGVLPVLGTKADRFEGSNINNDMIRQVATDFQVPLWDFDLLAGTIPGRGLDVDAVHLTTFYAHDYTSLTAYQRGHGVHNLSALIVLDAIWNEIIKNSSG